MGFVASKAVPLLNWDFRPYVDAAGVTPEPNRKALDAFRDALRDLGGEVGVGKDETTQQQIVDRFNAMEPGELESRVEELADEFLATVADVTSNSPSRQQLADLQETAPRIFQAYLGALAADLFSPEG